MYQASKATDMTTCSRNFNAFVPRRIDS